MAGFKEKIDEAEQEYHALARKLAHPELLSRIPPEELRGIKNRLTKLGEIGVLAQELRKTDQEIHDTEILKEEDPDLKELGIQELATLEEKKGQLTLRITDALHELSKKETEAADKTPHIKSVVAEIRQGVGGEEAALFAEALFHMYQKYAEKNGWRSSIIERHATDLGGVKEVIFDIEGEGVYEKLKYESGVHRVQRIPETEKSGRIHTSTTTVAILPQPKTLEVELKPEDIRIDVYRASGPGGQYVNRRESAVRIIHLATGIMVTSQSARTQIKNRENALKVLKARIFAKRLAELEEKRRRERKQQVGQGARSEKIRTYNFPQDRITDHRIKKSWHHMEQTLAGNLEPMVQELIQAFS